MMNRPDNSDTPEKKKAREAEISKAFMQYLSGMGDFADFNVEDWEEIHVSLKILFSTFGIRIFEGKCRPYSGVEGFCSFTSPCRAGPICNHHSSYCCKSGQLQAHIFAD
jgi:hypothetical protein